MHSPCNSSVCQDHRTLASLQNVLSWPFPRNPCLCSQAGIGPCDFAPSRVPSVPGLPVGGLLGSVALCEPLFPLSPDPEPLSSVERQRPKPHKLPGAGAQVVVEEKTTVSQGLKMPRAPGDRLILPSGFSRHPLHGLGSGAVVPRAETPQLLLPKSPGSPK